MQEGPCLLILVVVGPEALCGPNGVPSRICRLPARNSADNQTMVASVADLGVRQALNRAGIPEDGHVPSCVVVGSAGSGKTLVLDALRSRMDGTVVAVSGVRRSPDLVFGHLTAGSLADLTGVAPSASALRWALAEQLRERQVAALFVDDAHLLDGEAAAVVHSLAVHDDVAVFLACAAGTTHVAPPAVRSLWKDGYL